jgi:hypothetical protein
VHDAFEQLQTTEEWRKANQLDTLYETIDLEQYDQTRRLYPQWTGRRDRRGIPVYIFEVKHLNSKAMAEYEKSAKQTHSQAKSDGKTPAKLLRLFALYENLTRFVMPLSTVLTDRAYPATPITQSNNVVDISGVGLKQFWNLRAHMQDASQLATAHYPETLDRIFIIGAPSFFPTVWGWIKRWFDPITTSKIFILSAAEMETTLKQFIDPANIPKKYGGELDFNWGDYPKLDPILKDVVTWQNGFTDFPPGPMYWHDKGDSIELEAVGSEGGVQRSKIVCTVRKTHLARQAEDDAAGVSRPATAEGNASLGDLLKVPTIEEASARKQGAPGERPTLETFVTAQEDLQTLSLQDKEDLERLAKTGTLDDINSSRSSGSPEKVDVAAPGATAAASSTAAAAAIPGIAVPAAQPASVSAPQQVVDENQGKLHAGRKSHESHRSHKSHTSHPSRRNSVDSQGKKKHGLGGLLDKIHGKKH